MTSAPVLAHFKNQNQPGAQAWSFAPSLYTKVMVSKSTLLAEIRKSRLKLIFIEVKNLWHRLVDQRRI